MKGLLKAWIQEPIEFSTNLPNKPQRQGVTLLFNDGDLNPDKIAEIIQALNGREILLSLYKHFTFSDIEFLRCTISIGLKESEELILDELYRYPHHLTLAWADGVYPVLAAELSQSIEDKTQDSESYSQRALCLTQKAVIEWQPFGSVE